MSQKHLSTFIKYILILILLSWGKDIRSNPVYTFKQVSCFSGHSLNLTICVNLFKTVDADKFKQWENDINDKRKKELYSQALSLCKEMEQAAVETNSGYWLSVSHYYFGIIAKSQNNYKAALNYFLQILKEKNAFNNESERIFKLYSNTAETYKRLNSLPEAIIYYKKCLELKDKIKNNQFLVSAYLNLGSIYSSQSRFTDARGCYLNGLNLANDQTDYMTSIILNNLGNDEFSQGNYAKAIEYYTRSIQISEKNNDLNRLALTYNNLGNLYTKSFKDYKKAIEYYTKSLDIEKKLENNEGIASELINIGNVLVSQLKYKDAEKSFQDALHIFEKSGNTESIANTLEDLGYLYIKSRNNSKAISMFNQCIDLRKKNKNEVNLAYVYNNIGTVFFQQKDYQQSLLFYFKALELAKMKEERSLISTIYSGIQKTYAQSGQYDKAYKYLQDYSDLKDTLLNATISKQIIDIQEKYEKSKMEQKVAMQNLEIKNKSLQRNGLLAFLALAIIIFSSLLYFIVQKRKNEKLLYLRNTQLKDKEIVNLVQQSEIKSMLSLAEGQENERQRISRELHDRVGSMLSLVKLNLSSFADDDKPFVKENLALLDNTYQEVRNISHNLHSGLLTQFGLKAALNDLKNTVESHNAIRVNLFFTEEKLRMPKETEVVIFKILQELVTNALKHSYAKNLDIQINGDDDGAISVSVEDDGKGFDPSSSIKEGIGLHNIRYRISSIGGSLEINSSPGKGACFVMNIPAAALEEKI